MTRLFLIRHGEAAAAWGGDDHDPGLSELGRSQAEAAARVLAGLGSLRVLCSPMQRCRETSAPYLAKASAEALIEPRVSEVPTPADIADRRLWLQQNFPWRGGAVRSWREIDARLSPWRQALIECVSSVREDTAVFPTSSRSTLFAARRWGVTRRSSANPTTHQSPSLKLVAEDCASCVTAPKCKRAKCVEPRDHHCRPNARDR